MHLDLTFEFLVPKPTDIPPESEEFYRFFGGYSDSECCWSVYPRRTRVGVSWSIETYDARLIRKIERRMREEGFHPLIYLKMDKEPHGTKNQGSSNSRKVKFRLRLGRTGEVARLAQKLLPCSMHAEKIARMRIIQSHSGKEWSEVADEIARLRNMSKSEVVAYGRSAERAYNNRRERRPHNGVVG